MSLKPVKPSVLTLQNQRQVAGRNDPSWTLHLTGQNGDKEIDIMETGLPSLWNNQADISLHFIQDKLSSIEITLNTTAGSSRHPELLRQTFRSSHGEKGRGSVRRYAPAWDAK
jgi:hypothetical protein